MSISLNISSFKYLVYELFQYPGVYPALLKLESSSTEQPL